MNHAIAKLLLVALSATVLCDSTSAQNRTTVGQPANSPATTNETTTSSAKSNTDGWIARCYSNARKDPLECAADKAFARNGQIVATVSFRFPTVNGQPPTLLLQLPLTAFFASKINVVFSNSDNEELNLQYCDPQGCVFQTQLSQSAIGKARLSTQATVRFTNRAKEAAELVLPLAGLGAALAKIE